MFDKGGTCTESSAPGADFMSDLCQQWESAVDVSGTDVRPVTVKIGVYVCTLSLPLPPPPSPLSSIQVNADYLPVGSLTTIYCVLMCSEVRPGTNLYVYAHGGEVLLVPFLLLLVLMLFYPHTAYIPHLFFYRLIVDC